MPNNLAPRGSPPGTPPQAVPPNTPGAHPLPNDEVDKPGKVPKKSSGSDAPLVAPAAPNLARPDSVSPQTGAFLTQLSSDLQKLRLSSQWNDDNLQYVPFWPYVRDIANFFSPGIFGITEAEQAEMAHFTRMRLEQAVAVAHARAGGGKMADILALAADDMRSLDPWPGAHPVQFL